MSAVEPLGPPAGGAPHGLPRLLAGRGAGSDTLGMHLQRYGSLPGPVDRQFVDEIEHSGLRGRGGAAFPTAKKMRAVVNGRGPRTVVVNAKESEPASSKDELLLTELPHLVLDGATVAAEAVDARDVIVAVDRAYGAARSSVERALEERRGRTHSAPRIRVVDVPSRYVAGEESALVHFLEGGEAKPTLVPPRPFERGVRGRATLIQNVETLAAMALIARFGADWYRSIGPPSEPGSVLLTVGGAVARPGVHEIELGTPVSEVVDAAGGLTDDVSAFLFGGYFGAWVGAQAAWSLPISHDGLARAGVGLGGGVVFAFPANRCGLAETAADRAVARGRVRRAVRAVRARSCRHCRRADAPRAVASSQGRTRTARTLGRRRDRTRRVPIPRRCGAVRHQCARHVQGRRPSARVEPGVSRGEASAAPAP